VAHATIRQDDDAPCTARYRLAVGGLSVAPEEFENDMDQGDDNREERNGREWLSDVVCERCTAVGPSSDEYDVRSYGEAGTGWVGQQI